MNKKKKLFILILLPFCVSLKKDSYKTKHFDCVFSPFPAGCEASENCVVFINADHLSAVGKWTTEESMEEWEGRGEKRNTRKESYLKL